MGEFSRATSIYGPLDRVAVPHASELDTEAGWQQFQTLERQFEVGFQPTLPAPGTPEERLALSAPMAPVTEVQGEQGGLAFITEDLEDAIGAVASRTQGSITMTLAHALVWVHQDRRTAPVAGQWGLILAALEAVTRERPSAPSPRELVESSTVEQRIAMRRLVRWAHARDCLNRLMAHLQELPAVLTE